MDYHDQKSEAASQLEPIAGVPDENETTRLGLGYLRLAGIDVSQIATKPGTSDLDLHWEKDTIGFVDQRTRKAITLTNGYGVFFNRRIDGVKVGGIGRWGGVRAHFGNYAKVVDLQVCWRNLKPYELHDCPSPEQITKWIRNGQVKVRAISGAVVPVFGKLTITRATPLYDGKFQDQPMDFVFPYARFEAMASDGKDAIALWFEAPMTFTKGNWAIIR
jgi:hypothetical protein